MILRYFLPLLLLATLSSQAQNIITFESREAQTSAAITLDSVYIRHDGTLRDSTLIGVTSFDLGTMTGLQAPVAPLPGLDLGMPAPTVFDQRTRVALRANTAGEVTLRVYSIGGQCVASWSGELFPGQFIFEFDAASLPPGVYILTAATQSHAAMRKALKLGSGSGSAAGLQLLAGDGSSVPPPPQQSAAERWTFIGYASGYRPDTLASVEAKGGDRFTFLMTAEPAGMKLSTGRLHSAGSWQVQTQGGSIAVDKPGSPLHGFTITVPDTAHGETRQYDVSYADVTRHTLGADVRIITPMIQVSNGGGYANGVIVIRIPAIIPADEFAMAFLYNEKTGEIEGMPLLDEDATGLTVATRHFGTSSVAHSGFRKASGDWTGAVGNMFVASVKKSFLAGKSIISTGYDVKQDDWEFPNQGSYIAPTGHCAGQSITSMWYYYEKKLSGSPPLYHRLDPEDADSIWMDNPRGYKFASVIHRDINWESWLRHQLIALGDSSNHMLGYRALMLAMSLTGEPQYLRIVGDVAAHAIVAYRINATDSTVSIADPNFPGVERTLQFKDGYFQPYTSKLDATSRDNINFTKIGYLAKTSMVDWDKIAARWAQVENWTIGKVSPNNFPEIILRDQATLEELTSTAILVSSDTLTITWESNYGGLALIELGGVWNSAFKRVETSGSKIVLSPGTEQYRIFVYGVKNGFLEYLDYRWVYITNQVPTITDITPEKALRGQEIVIAGSGFGDDKHKGSVSINGMNMPDIVSWTENAIRVKLPEYARSGKIVVRRDSNYTKGVNYSMGSTVATVSPAHGYFGDTIRITGTELWRINYVRFNGERSDVTATDHISDSLITVRVPGGCIGGTVVVSTDFGEDIVSPQPFVMDAPVGSASPVEGKSGTVVTIIGNNLGGNIGGITAKVTIGGVEQQFVGSWTRNRLEFYARNSGQIELTVCGTTWKGPVFTLTP